MTALKIVFAIALALGTGAFAAAQTAPPGPARNTAVASNLRIVSPNDGQKLSVDYVNVEYQVTNPAAAANNVPTYEVSLDGGDPVQTNSTSHTFTGLAPGAHTITVEMVDANSLPVAGTLTQVHFVVTGPQNAPPAGTKGGAQAQQTPHIREISAQTATPGENSAQASNSQNSNLPSTSSALPLLSVIGFGVLVGGIASALKTR